MQGLNAYMTSGYEYLYNRFVNKKAATYAETFSRTAPERREFEKKDLMRAFAVGLKRRKRGGKRKQPYFLGYKRRKIEGDSSETESDDDLVFF